MDEHQALAAFEKALRSHEPAFGRFFLARLLDLDISYPEGKCLIRFPVRDFLFNPQGSLHGGIIATVMDISMGHLLQQTNRPGGATLEMKVQYLKPLTLGMATCEARFLSAGRNIAFLESRLYDDQNQLAAFSSSTWKVLSTRVP